MSLPTIETERLILRPFIESDADSLLVIYGNPEVARWSGSGEPMQSREAAVARIMGWPERIGPHPAAGIFAVLPRGTEDIVGIALLVPLPASSGVDNDDLEIGWHFRPDAWGFGYATESAATLVERAMVAGVEALFAVTHPENVRSQAVCRRLGMTDLGLSTQWYGRELRAFRKGAPSKPVG